MSKLKKDYFYVVKHFPQKTRSYLHDYTGEVLQVASWLAGKCVEKISRPNMIFDDRDNSWVSVCVLTKRPTKLNKKYVSFDGNGNFEDESSRFTKNSKLKWR